MILKENRFFWTGFEGNSISEKSFFFELGCLELARFPRLEVDFFCRRKIDSRFGVDCLFDGMVESSFRLDFIFEKCSRSDSGSIFFAIGHSSSDSDRISCPMECLSLAWDAFRMCQRIKAAEKRRWGQQGEESDGHLSQRQVFCELCTSRERFLASCKQCKQGHGSSLVISLEVSREAIILP